MNIVSGTFGTSGSAYLSKDGYIVVEGAKSLNYKPSDVLSLIAEQESESKLSFMGLVFGVLVTAVLFAFLNVVGLVIGLLVMYFGSKYTRTDDFVNIGFMDGERVRLECTPRQVERLVQFKG